MLFKESLAVGRAGESEVSRFIISHGYRILPAYEIEGGEGKGPRLYRAQGNLVAPDLLGFRPQASQPNRLCWFEVKTKSVWTWHENGQQCQDGIDRKHWEDYKQVQDDLKWPVWVLFLHRTAAVQDNAPDWVVPPASGLYGSTVNRMRVTLDHPSDRYGTSGMVYWNSKDLRLLSPYPFPKLGETR